uniref:ISXO2-like transposase domain-containing protein n=1 Tax=Octopus bimaculoides TaxID=37653 RepID=A0A0L8G2H4_OCTBM
MCNGVTETLLPIIERECEKDSVIHSDEWPAYSNLNAMGYHHFTVNHQEHYVDPETGAHTQAIERSWLDSKTIILKKMKGVGNELFRSHLDNFCWKVLRKDAADLFVEFLNDARSV